jgi:hypothetical protein
VLVDELGDLLESSHLQFEFARGVLLNQQQLSEDGGIGWL